MPGCKGCTGGARVAKGAAGLAQAEPVEHAESAEQVLPVQPKVWVESPAGGAVVRADRQAVRVRSRRIQRGQVERISGLPYFPFRPSKHCFLSPFRPRLPFTK